MSLGYFDADGREAGGSDVEWEGWAESETLDYHNTLCMCRCCRSGGWWTGEMVGKVSSQVQAWRRWGKVG